MIASFYTQCVQVLLQTRLCLLLETMHKHKRTHGNFTPHHIIADASTDPRSILPR